jgi:CRP-like cAMP-binding protein
MDNGDLGGLLAETSLFRPLLTDRANPARAALLQAFRPVRFDAGQSLFSRGDAGQSLLVIAEGRVRLSVMTEEGRELSVRHATRGAVIGEIAMLDGGPRSADAVALSEGAAWSLGRAEAMALIARNADFASALIAFLCGRLRDTTDQLEAIALYPIEARLARFLLIALKGRAAEAGRRLPLDLGFSQAELAQLLGASRPKVNGALSALEEAGAIKRTADRLFCDPAALMRFARLPEDGERPG